MKNLRTSLTDFARSLTWYRRMLAAGLAAAGVALAIEAASPAPPETASAVTAAQNVIGGTVIGREHIKITQLPPASIPDGALTPDEAVGRVLAGPVNAGEVLTNTRIVGDGLLSGWGPDMVAVPVRLADTAASALLRHGDRIDVIAARADGSGSSRVVAETVPVLTVTSDKTDTIASNGDLVVVAASAGQASAIISAVTTSQLSFTLRGAVPE